MNKIRLSILVVFSFLQCLTAHAQYMSAELIYKYAKSKDYNALSRLRGYLEMQDSKGNTPLCLAVIDDNYDAYNLLRQYGAYSQPYCLQSAIAASGSSGTFLGMGTKGWLITGAVVAAGAGVAAAAGGGGGGGGSSSSSSLESSKVDCVNGMISGDKCVCNEGWTGDSCSTAVSCSYSTKSCTGGYEETGNTCKSGNITYKECKAKTVPSGYTPNACGSGYTTTGTFLSGNTTYYKCTPAACEGYIESCNTGYHTTTDTCLSGTQTKYKCEADACDGFNYTTCPSGYESSDTCLSGTTTKYKCAPAACSGFNYTTCPNGYESAGTCLSGTNTKHKCVPAACDGFNYTTCPSGYESSDTCLSGTTTKHKCAPVACSGFNYTTCPNGYESAGTCLSGTTTKHKCKVADCTGFDYTTCPNGYESSDTCLSGTTTKHKCAPTACEGYVASCDNGYHATTDTCLSGATTMYKCEADSCTGFEYTACPNGYESAGTCLSGTTTKHKCKVADCTGFDYTTCPNGYESSDTCLSGTTTKYKCAPAACSGFDYTTCPSGYESSDTCLSGTTTKYKCAPAACSGFDYTTCPSGYESSDTCLSGTTTKYKCVLAACSGYSYTTCPDGYVPSGTCLSGNVLKYKCTDKTVNGSNITVENSDDTDSYGFFSDTDRIYNTYEGRSGSITIYNKGNGNTYGIYGNIVYNMELGDAMEYTENATISINNEKNGNVYGMYGDYAYNVGSQRRPVKAVINIINSSDGDVYGIYSNRCAINAVDTKNGFTVSGKEFIGYGMIDITNSGDGNVYGVYGERVINARRGTGIIKITNSGKGSVYGMYSSGQENIYNVTGNDKDESYKGIINITNTGNGNVYGMHGYSVAYKDPIYGVVKDTEEQGGTDSKISIINENNGTSCGIHGQFIANNNGDSISSLIEIVNVSEGTVFGMYGEKYSVIKNSGDIKMYNLSSGITIGIAASDSNISYAEIYNSGTIEITRDKYTNDDVTYNVNSNKKGNGIGIYASNAYKVVNSGTIKIIGAENAIGIYSGSIVTNSGTIAISDVNTAYGIYVEAGASVNNTGTISINGISCIGAKCGTKNNAIILNGSALFQDGELIVSSNTSPQSANLVTTANTVAVPPKEDENTTSANIPASLNLNDFGGTVVASGTSKFIVEDSISGDLAINNNVIENGFDTTYAVNSMIEAADTSGLNLISQSALFDATLENNTDAVMTMKSFDSVVNNDSLADFLQNNYAEENNEKLFRTLKGVETVAQLNDTLDELSGKNMFSRMAFEDLSMLREVSFDMNGKLFKENGAYALSGNVSPANYDNNAGSVGRYSLNGFNDGKRSFGFGVSITDVHTNDRSSDNRRFDRNFMMSAPLGYKTHGFELITAPKAGYSDGTYNRNGFDDMSYEGKVQKRMFALMNEARYPVKFGGLKLTPSAEFNMIGYNVRGHENESEYSLRIKSQNHYSVEAGFGLMAEKEFKMPKNHKFGLNGGVAMYHEFADPYELEVSMNGMNGTFKIRDERRKDNRAVLRSGFDYGFGEDLSLVGSIAAYLDGTNNTNANLDLKLAF